MYSREDQRRLSETLIRMQGEIEQLQADIEKIKTDEKFRFSKVAVTDGITAPIAVSGIAFIFVDTSDGDLKVRFGDNVTKTLATDT